MKSKLLMLSLVGVLIFAVSAFAQDSGIRDTVALELTVDVAADTARLEFWMFSDQRIDGFSSGFYWEAFPGGIVTLDTAYALPVVSDNFVTYTVYENSSRQTSNDNDRFQFGGISFGTPIPGDASGRRLFGTWSFSLTGDPDGLMFDTATFNAGSVYLWSATGGIEWEPYYTGKVIFGDPSLDADDDADGQRPESFALDQNYPNPFNPTTDIRFSLPTKADVTLKIYNILGQEVTTLLDKEMEAGHHTVDWDASENATGVYFYKIVAGDFTETRKMMLLK